VPHDGLPAGPWAARFGRPGLFARLQPALELADEPTGKLDTQSANSVFDLLREVSSGGTTFLIVTHDPRLVARCDRLFELVDGCVEGDKATPVARPSTVSSAA
jgi:ABC-type lipoprotein export system ATPase subunit